MSANITITWAVPIGYQPGDYAKLYGNGGSSNINYDSPLTIEKFVLFQDGGGIYGWYQMPWYKFPWYQGYATRCLGWYQLPWYKFPWYHGTTLITVRQTVFVCGVYKFALKIFDRLGNENVGETEEVEAVIHIAPPAPTGLTKGTYDKESNILILEAA